MLARHVLRQVHHDKRRQRSDQPRWLAGGPRRSATQRLEECCSQIVKTAIMIGTPMKAPEIPHRNVQKNTANRTTEGEIDRALPETRGSR